MKESISSKNLDMLKKSSDSFNIQLDESQLEQFQIYWQFLDEYNKHTNLVSSTEQDVVFTRHFIDSLSIGLYKNNKDNKDKLTFKNIIDIGIGGGFPGIPLIIAFPEARLCAVDSVGKKIKFLELLSKELGVESRIDFQNKRAEDLAQDTKYRQKFDISATRAVGHLSIIAEYCLPFVKIGGHFVPYKAKNIETEIAEAKAAIRILGGAYIQYKNYSIPEIDEPERNLVLIKKVKSTPQIYPRSTGIPAKSPLK